MLASSHISPRRLSDAVAQRHEVGFHLEDLLVLTEDGHEIVTNVMETSRMWPVKA